jgi:hypothetical protein
MRAWGWARASRGRSKQGLWIAQQELTAVQQLVQLLNKTDAP